MVTKGYNLYKTLIINILSNMKNINACRNRSMVEAVTLLLSIKGRINFQQLERYGKYSDQRYRIQLENPIHIMGFSSNEYTSETQSLMRLSYVVFCFTKKT